jgi:hypothetical protein
MIIGIASVLAPGKVFTFISAMLALGMLALIWIVVALFVWDSAERIAKPKASQGGGSLQAISKD